MLSFLYLLLESGCSHAGIVSINISVCCFNMSLAIYNVSLDIDLGMLDLVLNFPGYHRPKFTSLLRNILKVIVSLIWAIVLPIFYLQTVRGLPDVLKGILSFLNKVKGVPTLYVIAVALYLLPNLLGAILFLFPMLRRWIENSDWHIVRLFLWWSQVFTLLYYV